VEFVLLLSLAKEISATLSARTGPFGFRSPSEAGLVAGLWFRRVRAVQRGRFIELRFGLAAHPLAPIHLA